MVEVGLNQKKKWVTDWHHFDQQWSSVAQMNKTHQSLDRHKNTLKQKYES